MRIKAIVTDLDGTLLDTKKQISDYTKHVLQNTLDKGIQICIATGRTPTKYTFHFSHEWFNTI